MSNSSSTVSSSNTPASPTSASGEKFRVLVVEDDPNIARLVLVTLSKMGFECRHAADGVAGMEAFKEAPPHLVLLDLGLPGMDGRQVCTEIRKMSTVPVVIMTANDSEAMEVQSFKLGADDYVPKPFNPKLLVARVVANLRRAYRYDVPEPEAATGTSVSTTPLGWATCEACGYMGPQQKFEQKSGRGQVSMLCPYCKQSEHIMFSAG